MCGIVGLINVHNSCANYLLNGLTKLQNRGYDSAGICTINNKKEFILRKYASNEVSALTKVGSLLDVFTDSNIGIGHTRWATHGAKTDTNSHPHVSSDNKFIIVHNGIIENYNKLKEMLTKEGYTFISETDSEIICNLLSYNYKIKTNSTITEIIKYTMDLLEGTWGLCILCLDTPNILYCTRNGSPILVGRTDDYAMIVSEQSAFEENVTEYIVLNNHDICMIKLDNGSINIETKHVYNSRKITNTNFQLTPEPYLHWTIKEIYEQKDSCLRAISFGGRLLSSDMVKLGGIDKKKDILKDINNLILLGCGTSYNAGLCGLNYFKELCIFNTIQIFDGAEFKMQDVPLIGKTALILLSQSGETKDLHRCIKLAKDNNIITIGVVNVVDSLISREVDCGCYLNAGREVSVASTKSFTSQCIVLSMIALWFSNIQNVNRDLRNTYIKDLMALHSQICEMLEDLEIEVEKLVPIFKNKSSCFVLGKGTCEPIAYEGSLKIKEISYIHSEGYSTSSLKHGPFALYHELKNHLPLKVLNVQTKGKFLYFTLENKINFKMFSNVYRSFYLFALCFKRY